MKILFIYLFHDYFMIFFVVFVFVVFALVILLYHTMQDLSSSSPQAVRTFFPGSFQTGNFTQKINTAMTANGFTPSNTLFATSTVSLNWIQSFEWLI